jgi:hypothetical protein
VAGSGLASATPSSTMRGALEAMHSVDLGHPNIVQTYRSTQRLVQVGLPARSCCCMGPYGTMRCPPHASCAAQHSSLWVFRWSCCCMGPYSSRQGHSVPSFARLLCRTAQRRLHGGGHAAEQKGITHAARLAAGG